MAAYNNSAVLNTPLGRGSTSPAPPIPPRPVRNTYNSGYNSYSSPYNSYMRGGYMSPFNNYGGYGGYGSYGGFGSYGFGSFRPSLGSYNSSYPENRQVFFLFFINTHNLVILQWYPK